MFKVAAKDFTQLVRSRDIAGRDVDVKVRNSLAHCSVLFAGIPVMRFRGCLQRPVTGKR